MTLALHSSTVSPYPLLLLQKPNRRYLLHTTFSLHFLHFPPPSSNKINNTCSILFQPTLRRPTSRRNRRQRSSFPLRTFQIIPQHRSDKAPHLHMALMRISPLALSRQLASAMSLPNQSFTLLYWRETLKSVNGAAI